MRKCCDEVKVVKEDECVTEAKNAFLSVALIVGILTIIVGICVAVYKYLTPDYLDDFDDYDDARTKIWQFRIFKIISNPSVCAPQDSCACLFLENAIL